MKNSEKLLAQVRNKESQELFVLVGFVSESYPTDIFVTEVHLKSHLSGRYFCVSGFDFDQEYEILDENGE